MVFVREYTGTIYARDVVQVISPPPFDGIMNEETLNIRKERIGGMLELAGGRFSTFQHEECKSVGVCACRQCCFLQTTSNQWTNTMHLVD